MKSVLFAANWKLNKGPRQTSEYLAEFRTLIPQERQGQIVFFPPATNLESAAKAIQGTGFRFGSQNCHTSASGAFTGEISAAVVKEMGGQLILLGHSERRQIFGETDELIAQKGRLVQELGLMPMICIGETLEERETGKTSAVCEGQLKSFMSAIDVHRPWIVAYEPVWAIGTGKVATVEQVQETHTAIKEFITRSSGVPSISILYGGSVKPDNAKELLQIKSVNGFLVGGASLEAKSFSQICLS